MIVDLERFAAAERPYWAELEALLDALERAPGAAPDLAAARRLYYLYRRAASGLARLSGHGPERELRAWLEALVARAYAQMHESRAALAWPRLRAWLGAALPRTVRRHRGALALSVLATLLGSGFGALAVAIDSTAKATLLPFPHLAGDPSERVAEEESAGEDRLEGHRATFAAQLATHNLRVSILAMALGMTAALGTFLLLFYNGIVLGAVAFDYLRAGEGVFLAGWLLPHGSVEIPAILIAGQAGIVLGHALIGWGSAHGWRTRMRRIGPDLVALIAGVAILLAWAGLVESFFSQYHEPAVPYAAKIAFGAVQLAALAAWLAFAGRRAET